MVRYRGRPDDDVAFVGGIDLCHGRNDDAHHLGDPEAVAVDQRYGPRPAWHDLQMEIRGPVIGDLVETFRERWEDPLPLGRGPWRRHLAKAVAQPVRPSPLPLALEDPGEIGPHAVQVLRTYPAKRPPSPFAPSGERSIARAYMNAFGRARRLIYVEDQYLWSFDAARALGEALRREPELLLVVVVPKYPDDDGRIVGPPNRIGQLRVIKYLQDIAGPRLAVYDLEVGMWPVYVHAKVCIIDDVWMTVGSDNFNRRSWTHDSEISCAILDDTKDAREPTDPAGRGDGARVLARSTRLALWHEHLGGVDVAVDPVEGFAMMRASADALDAWHESGQVGARPPGRLRNHRPTPVPMAARPLSRAFYRFMSDPDGRPWARRLRRCY